MPIRPENKTRYPKEWPQISRAIRANALNQCEWCGVRNYSLGAWIEGNWHVAEPKGTGLRDNPRAGENFPGLPQFEIHGFGAGLNARAPGRRMI